MTIKQLTEYARAKYDQPGRRWERLTGPIGGGEERREGCSFDQILAELLAHRVVIDANDKMREIYQAKQNMRRVMKRAAIDANDKRRKG